MYCVLLYDVTGRVQGAFEESGRYSLLVTNNQQDWTLSIAGQQLSHYIEISIVSDVAPFLTRTLCIRCRRTVTVVHTVCSDVNLFQAL